MSWYRKRKQCQRIGQGENDLRHARGGEKQAWLRLNHQNNYHYSCDQRGSTHKLLISSLSGPARRRVTALSGGHTMVLHCDASTQHQSFPVTGWYSLSHCPMMICLCWVVTRPRLYVKKQTTIYWQKLVTGGKPQGYNATSTAFFLLCLKTKSLKACFMPAPLTGTIVLLHTIGTMVFSKSADRI